MPRPAILPVPLVSILIALAVLPWTIASPRLRDEVASRLLDHGIELRVSGDTTLALLPLPRLTLSNVSLAASDPTPAAAGAAAPSRAAALVDGTQLRAELRLLPLLIGRIELASVSFVGGSAIVAVDRDGQSSWDGVVERVTARLADPDRSHGFLNRLALSHMTLAIADPSGSVRTRLDQLHLALTWPGPDATLSGTATATWHGETMRATLSDISPLQLARGGASTLAVTLASRLGKATITGEVALAGTKRLNGLINADAPSLRAFLAWTGLRDPAPGSPDAVGIAGEIALSADEVALPRTQLTFSGQRLDGAVMVRLDAARPVVRATLAGDALDLSGLVAWHSAQWRAAPIDLGALQQAGLDLRVSASRVVVDGLVLGDVAFGLLTSPSRVEVSLGRATFAGGSVKGRVSAQGNAARYEVKVQTTFDRIEMGDMLVALGRTRQVTGSSHGLASLETVGGTPNEMLRALSGRFGMSVKDGDFENRPVTSGTRGEERRPGASVGSGSRTPFQDLALSLSVANGVAEVTEGAADGGLVRAAATGRLSLVDGMFDLRIHTGRAGEPLAAANAKYQNAGFSITGRWDGPVIRALEEPVAAPPP